MRHSRTGAALAALLLIPAIVAAQGALAKVIIYES